MPATDLQLDWLRAFVAAVDTGSLTAAGRLVHRSQSALSMQIAKLEQAVGRPVLVRTPRRLDLTVAGRELLGHARRLVAQHDEAVQAMQREAIYGRLSVGVPEDYAAPYLTPVLRDFARRHAGVELTLVCEQSTVLIPRVLRGEIDIAVVTRDRAGRGRPLFEEPLVWAGSPRSETWRTTPLPLAVYEQGSRARRAALAALGARRRPYRIVCDTASPAGMLAAVDSGLAVALLSRCCRAAACRSASSCWTSAMACRPCPYSRSCCCAAARAPARRRQTRWSCRCCRRWDGIERATVACCSPAGGSPGSRLPAAAIWSVPCRAVRA